MEETEKTISSKESQFNETHYSSNENNYRSILENINDALFIIDFKGKILDVNEKACDSSGHTKNDLIGSNIYNIYRKSLDFGEKKKIEEQLMKKGNISFDTYHERKDGSSFHVNISLRVVSKAENGIIQTFVRDVSEQKRAEEALLKSEKLYRETLTMISDPVFITDIAGNFCFICSNIEVVFGCDEDELNKKYGNIYNIFGNDFFDINTLNDVGEIRNIEKEIVDVNGIIHVLLVNVKKVSMDAGQILITCRDITNLKKSQIEVIKTKEYLRNVINSASEVIFAIDKNRNFTLWNSAAEYISGYSKRQILNMKINELDIFINSDNIKFDVERFFKEKINSFHSFILKSNDGLTRTFSFSCSQMKSSDGKLEGVLFIGRDITFDKEIHDELLNGVSYFLLDNSDIKMMNFLTSVIHSDYKGLFFTRRNPNLIDVKILRNSNIEIVFLQKDKSIKYDTANDLSCIVKKIDDFTIKNNKSMIMLDGFCYLISMFSFKNFLKSLFQINEIISKNNSTLFVNVNSKIIDPKQLSVLQDELILFNIDKLRDIKIDNDHHQILTYINDKFEKNINTTIGEIKKVFQITSPTAIKRVKYLKNQGLINEQKKGRSKILSITKRGRDLLKN